jgi:hypothetical protein
MISRTPTLADWHYRMVCMACDLCEHRSQYRKDTLITRFGGDVLCQTCGTSSRNVRGAMRQGKRAGCIARTCAVATEARMPLCNPYSYYHGNW